MTREAKRRRPDFTAPPPAPPRRVRRDTKQVDRELDDALAATFPASDPVAVDADERERPRKR
ncbi:MAG: hypothetical protein HS109_04970 [Burkholderiales bacterium]|nr:hypothetical protein [Burkholderiales bacterium]